MSHERLPSGEGGRKVSLPTKNEQETKKTQTEHSLIGAYYGKLLNRVSSTIIELESLHRWIDREAPLANLKDEISYSYGAATNRWLDEYTIIKEPKVDANLTLSVHEMCNLCTSYFEAAKAADNIDQFVSEFMKLNNCVLRISSIATSILSTHNFPTSR